MRIAVDAMGGDHAPGKIVQGALDAAGCFDGVEVLLAGVPALMKPFLPETIPSNVEIIGCEEIVEMDEPPVEAIKGKKDSSLRRIFEMVGAGKADAAVSAGNTGATVAAASMLVGPLEGCRRPGIAAPFPAKGRHTIVIDVGANISPRPVHLLQYAVMARLFAREIVGTADPKVGLLNVGQEPGKGTHLVRVVHDLLAENIEGFVGNVEGRDIFDGSVDVVVCDGFVGNALMKCIEGYSAYLFSTLVANISANLPDNHSRLTGFIQDFIANNDYREYGGAPLLGIGAPVIIAHGSSDATAISNAIRVARDCGATDVNRLMVEALRDLDSRTGREDNR
ncbi:MAG: phosphate acyltransferase PlsX [Planctomycetes bacterium]|nr:phosphate acyltransferase PlsX [Planctomycetota bacterium]